MSRLKDQKWKFVHGNKFILLFVVWGMIFFGMIIYGISKGISISIIALYATSFNLIFILLFFLYMINFSSRQELKADVDGIYIWKEYNERELFRIDFNQIEDVYWNVKDEEKFAIVFTMKERGKKLKIFTKDKIQNKEIFKKTVWRSVPIIEESMSLEKIREGIENSE